MYKVNFNHLHYFLTIAKEGSIVKASKKLHITQPALSHQLKLLELDLGKKLFDRKGRRLVINKNGEFVKEYAQKIFRNSEEMLEFLKTNDEDLIKIIKIGVVPWLSKTQTYSFIKKLIFSPHIKVQLFQKDIVSLMADIQQDRVDILLCDSPYSGRSRKLQGHLLAEDPIYCVSSSKVGFSGKFPQNLNDKKFINYSEACQMGDNIDQYIEENNINLKAVGEFSDSSLMRYTIEQGGIVGFLPKSIVSESLKNKKLVKLGELKEYNFSLWAISKKGLSEKSIISSLINQKIRL